MQNVEQRGGELEALADTFPLFSGLLLHFSEQLGDLKAGRTNSITFYKVTLEEWLSMGSFNFCFCKMGGKNKFTS